MSIEVGDRVIVKSGKKAGQHGTIAEERDGQYVVRFTLGDPVLCDPDEIEQLPMPRQSGGGQSMQWF